MSLCMPNLGSSGPPSVAPSVPEVSLTYDDIEQANRQQIDQGHIHELYRIELNSGRSTTPVAVKQPATDQTISAEFVSRFTDGAELWARLNTAESITDTDAISAKDHIVGVVGWNESPVPWLAMEYMDAGDLTDVVGDGRLPVEQGLWVGKAVCRALWHAHRQGVVHHDIKPGNVLFRQTQHGWLFPKVGDWGIARAMGTSDAHDGLTVAYAAPEQLESQSYGDPDPATDIYQAGTLVYELLTGQLPFDGDAAGIRDQKLSADPTPPSELIDVSTAVDEALLPALQRSKASRYDSIAYLRDELEALFEVYRDAETDSGAPSRTTSPTTARSPKTVDGQTDEPQSDATEPSAPETVGDDESTAGEETTSPYSSWETYRDELRQREQHTIYSLCPPSVQRLLFSDLVNEVETAEQRRDEAKSTFDSLEQQARKQRHIIEDEVYDAQLLGEEFAEDAMDTALTLEQLQSKLQALETDATRYLRAGEQETIATLRSDLAEYERYLRAKRKLTRTVTAITPRVHEVEAELEETLEADQLLSLEDEQQLLAGLDEVSQLIRTARQRLRTEYLSESDLRRLDTLVDTERTLRSRLTEHNPAIAQRRYDAMIEEIAPAVDERHTALQASREDGDSLPAETEAYIDAIDHEVTQIDTFRDTRAVEYLTESQRERIEGLREEIQEQRQFITAKTEFETLIDEASHECDRVESMADATLNMQQYLTASDAAGLRDSIDEVKATAADAADYVDPLAEADEKRYTEIIDTLDEIETAIEEYNETYVDAEVERIEDQFSSLGEDNLSLNHAQRRAVVVDEEHNRIIAGPGTGKTFSLACRCRYLIEKDVAPDRILALSFNRNAADEIRDRVAELFGITEVQAKTLHSIGKNIVNRVHPDRIVLVGQPRKREISRARRQLYQNDAGSEAAVADAADTKTADTPAETTGFSHHFDQLRSLYQEEQYDTDRRKQKQFFESLKYSSTKTLRGEKLAPSDRGERAAHRDIANTLFKQGIEYRYRQFAPWARDLNEAGYTPDFTLPEYNLAIEYYPRQRTRQRKKPYNRKPDIARLEQLYQEADTERRYIALHGDDHSPSSLTKILKAKLEQAGVEFDPMSTRADLIRATYDHNKAVREIESHLAEFVKKAKSTGFEMADLDTLDKEDDPLVYHFSHAAAQVYQKYTSAYEAYQAIDYIDMISKASVQLNNGRAVDWADYDHILIDEFQDLNLAQIELTQALLNAGSESHLYAVGDDWQSIYGFKGARPEFFTAFDEYFTPAETTKLEKNYRCPPAVVEASNALMAGREEVVSKSVEADSSVETTPTVHHIMGSNDYQYEQNAIHHICTLVKESIEEDDRSAAEILIVARNQAGSPFIQQITEQLDDWDIAVGGNNGVRVTKAHQSKGTEAEHVIIANAAADRHDGFPAIQQARELTTLVDRAEESGLAEERRLFYVALTRTKDRLDIQTRASQVSSFVDDIDGYTDDEYIPFSIESECVNIEATVTDTKDGKEGWTVDQLGTLRLDGGYELSFAIPTDSGADISLSMNQHCQLQNVTLGDHNGAPQLQLTEETAAVQEPSTND